jgi:hypothetical protein
MIHQSQFVAVKPKEPLEKQGFFGFQLLRNDVAERVGNSRQHLKSMT